MRKRFLLLFFFVMPALLFAAGWGIGVEAGYSYTMVNTSTGWIRTENHNGHGFDFAVPVEYEFNDHISLASGVRYIMKSSRYMKSNVDDIVLDDYSKEHHMLEFPLTVRLCIGSGRFSGFAGFGGYVGVRFLETRTGFVISETEDANGRLAKYNFAFQPVELTSWDNLFDAGLIAELGLSYELGAGDIYLAARYQYGLTSLAKNQQMAAHAYLDNLSVGLGYMFRLGGDE